MSDPTPQPSPPPSSRAPALASIYLESRYRKLERGLPQTIFYCPECKGHRRRAKNCKRCEGFGKLTKDSVQELIARQILPAFRARNGKFHGAGREDLDVLMLGRGRPFVYEVVGARRPDVDLAALDARIATVCGGRVELAPMEPVTRDRVVFWKESQFAKIYRARVEVEGAVDADRVEGLVGRSLDIVQRTPSRVAHRRADLRREREVRIFSVAEVGADGFALEIQCAHGTYVKEWISSDAGRTDGSLTGLLGVDCRCVQLDVLEIVTDQGPTQE